MATAARKASALPPSSQRALEAAQRRSPAAASDEAGACAHRSACRALSSPLIGAAEPVSPPRSSSLLRHPLHRAPALQRGPDAAFKPEAIDRHGRTKRADAAQSDTGPLEAALFEHAP